MYHITCKECSKTYTRKDNFKRHLMICNGSVPSYECKCGKTYNRNDNLKQHVKLCKVVNRRQSESKSESNSSDSSTQPKTSDKSETDSSDSSTQTETSDKSGTELSDDSTQLETNGTSQSESEPDSKAESEPDLQAESNQSNTQSSSCSSHNIESGDDKSYDGDVSDDETMKVHNDDSEQRNGNQSEHQSNDEDEIEGTWKCKFCDVEVKHNKKLAHFQSSDHKSKALLHEPGTDEDVFLVKGCFANKIVIYRILNLQQKNIKMDEFLMDKKEKIINLLKKYVNIHKNINYQLEITTRFVKLDVDGEIIDSLFYINHKYETLNLSQANQVKVLNEKIDGLLKQLCANTEEITTKGSNWTLSKIMHVDVHINKKSVLLGGSYLRLPQHIQKKKACINPTKNDDQCFKWCVKAYFLYQLLKDEHALHVQQIKQSNLTKKQCLIVYENQKLRKRLSDMSVEDEQLVDETFNLSWNTVQYPMPIEKLEQFVALNTDININVLGVSAEDEKTIVGPLYQGGRKANHNINLLLLTDDQKTHYCWIKDLSRLAARQKKNRRERQYYCQVCLLGFNSEEKLQIHFENDCQGKI